MGYLLDNTPKRLQGLQLLLTNFTDALEIRLQDSRQEELVNRIVEETTAQAGIVVVTSTSSCLDCTSGNSGSDQHVVVEAVGVSAGVVTTATDVGEEQRWGGGVVEQQPQ
ncbi:hypothetical protein NL676_038501 [Syzygium grande]|nr:hypothetical protein NL676_038501 [Syzygium grande]